MAKSHLKLDKGKRMKVFDELQGFAARETQRIIADEKKLNCDIVAKNGTYQRRAEVTYLLINRLVSEHVPTTPDDIFAITNAIKSLADYHYEKRGLIHRWRFKRGMYRILLLIHEHAQPTRDLEMARTLGFPAPG